MADLESALSYSLHVELSSTAVFKGDALSALKGYIAVLAKVGLTSTVLCGRVQYTAHVTASIILWSSDIGSLLSL